MATDHSDSAADSLDAFTADLRALRRDADNPTLATLERRTGISKSVLSDALAGRRLPTERTTATLVATLGGDEAAWVARRARLDPRNAGAGVPIGGSTPAIRPGGPRFSLPALIGVGVGAALLSAILTSLVWTAVVIHDEGETTTAPGESYLDVADDVDPMQTKCREDAVIAASEERLDGDVQVQMMYSNQCMAVWGRVTRYDGEAAGNSVTMRIYPAIDMTSDRSQERSAFDVQSVYTTLLIEPDVDARVCGIATVTRDGESIELGPPVCI